MSSRSKKKRNTEIGTTCYIKNTVLSEEGQQIDGSIFMKCPELKIYIKAESKP